MPLRGEKRMTIEVSGRSPRLGNPVNEGSSTGGGQPRKESQEKSDGKQGEMEQWARDNVAEVAAKAQALTTELQSPDIEGEEREALKVKRTAMLGRLAAMQRLLG